MEGFRGYTDCLPGAREKGALYGTGLWKKGDVNAGPFPLQAREMGRNV